MPRRMLGPRIEEVRSTVNNWMVLNFVSYALCHKGYNYSPLGCDTAVWWTGSSDRTTPFCVSSFTNTPISYRLLPLLCTVIPTKLTSALKIEVACSFAALYLSTLLHGITLQKTEYFANIHWWCILKSQF